MKAVWLVCALWCACLSAQAGENGQPQSLFDGHSLSGWEGDEKTFRVEDGAVVGGSLAAKVPHNEFLCTRREYGDFELRLKFKLLGENPNAGVQFRSQRVPNHFEVSGYQADLADDYWGALYDEARRKKALVKADPAVIAKALQRGQWNEYVIRCQGPHIQLWINGYQTVDYTEPDDSIPRRGIIGLQIHGGLPSEAWYKDITIQEL